MSHVTPESPKKPEPGNRDPHDEDDAFAGDEAAGQTAAAVPAAGHVGRGPRRAGWQPGEAEHGQTFPAAGQPLGAREASTPEAPLAPGYTAATAEQPGYQPVTDQPPAGYEPPSEPLPESAPQHSDRATTAYETQPDAATSWAPEPTAPASEAAAAAETAAPASEPAAAAVVTPVYVTAPTPPKAKGNRGVGILIVLLATIVYAIVYAAVSFAYFALTAIHYMTQFDGYLTSVAFWVPVAAFFLFFVLLVALVNRGGWWAYVLGGFIVAVLVYGAYIGGALLQVQAWTMTTADVMRLLGQLWANPLTLGAAIVAREVTLWFGAWIAARGRRVRRRNVEAQRDFDREVAEGPSPQGAGTSSA
jgi:U5 snRNP spliceosome subunit